MAVTDLRWKSFHWAVSRVMDKSQCRRYPQIDTVVSFTINLLAPRFILATMAEITGAIVRDRMQQQRASQAELLDLRLLKWGVVVVDHVIGRRVR